MGQKITPNLWFNGNAQAAADFYVATFPDSKILSTTYYPKTTAEGLADFQQDLAGDVLTIELQIFGLAFTLINAGNDFRPNPALSFMVNFDPSRDDQAKAHLDEVWQKLTAAGRALLLLGEYSYSPYYGWVEDDFGISWQLMLTNPEGDPRPNIIPAFSFGNVNIHRAEEAIQYYLSVFKDSQLGAVHRFTEDTGSAKAGSIMFADFKIAGQWFAAMTPGKDQDYTFNEGVSLSVACKDQAEIDYFWEKLSTVPEAEVCGWCKDQFGVSWQVVPENTAELLQRPGAFAHMMQMQRLIIADF